MYIPKVQNLCDNLKGIRYVVGDSWRTSAHMTLTRPGDTLERRRGSAVEILRVVHRVVQTT